MKCPLSSLDTSESMCATTHCKYYHIPERECGSSCMYDLRNHACTVSHYIPIETLSNVTFLYQQKAPDLGDRVYGVEMRLAYLEGQVDMLTQYIKKIEEEKK